MDTSYLVDKTGRIVGVSDTWESFGPSINQPCVAERSVVGRRLWSFIADEEIVRHLEDILFACRARGEAYATNTACLTEAEYRLYETTFVPQCYGLFEITNRLVYAVDPLADPAPTVTRFLCRNRCLSCGALRFGSHWEPGFSKPPLAEFPSHKVACPTCREADAGRDGHGGQGQPYGDVLAFPDFGQGQGGVSVPPDRAPDRHTSRDTSFAARTKSAKRGCGAKGFDFSSG